MSNCASEWLVSQNRFRPAKGLFPQNIVRHAKTISVISGKGGVGKTSVSIKMARLFADSGKKVLLIDCDYNLSNTYIKLGIPISENLHSITSKGKKFEECLYRDGNFHLLAGCNGEIDFFEKGPELDRMIIDILMEHEKDYDYILLDCPAGISREVLAINAYCDFRFVVVTPDKSSITDSYALMKILNARYGINENHLLLNKISSNRQYKRIVKSLGETVENFLNCRLHVMGGISMLTNPVDLFDPVLMNDKKSGIHEDFLKVLEKFTEEEVAPCGEPTEM